MLGGLKGPTRHYFCKACLSWLFTRPDGLEGMVNIRTPMLADAKAFPPFVEFYLDQGIPGASSGAPHRFRAAPEVDAFLTLSKDYEAWECRPA